MIPYEQDEVTRLIVDSHDKQTFEPISHLTVGDFRNWLLSDTTSSELLTRVAPGIKPEMAAAVSKLMRNQDLILTAKKCRVVTRFRNTIGLPGHLSVRLQPNHPTDDLKGIAASMLDGLLYGSGDAVIGINPASDSLPLLEQLNYMLDDVIHRFEIPTQSCVLTHVTNTLKLIERGAPVGLVFQSIAGTEATNASFGFNLATLEEAHQAALSLQRGTLGCDVCYTNHAEADQDDMDTLLTLLASAGLTYLMGIPGADDIMLNYQSTSFHDALYVRELLGLKHAPEFGEWLARMKILDTQGRLCDARRQHPLLQHQPYLEGSV